MQYRYAQLNKLVKELGPKTILEVGTWNGYRGIDLISYAPDGAMYYGFDLFEDMTEELDKLEHNVKCHVSLHMVNASFGVFPHKLIKGNTRDTLPKFAKRKIGIDFAFIDGGHSIDTITSDFKNVRKMMNKGGVIILDDFYDPPMEGVGCNEVVKDVKHELLPEKDKMPGKKHVINMARVNT